MAYHQTRLLPRDNEEVVIEGLKGAKQHNGKTGTIVSYSREQGRYRVKLQKENQVLGVKLSNLTVKKQEDEPTTDLHILIPCHIDTDRRLITFLRSAKSIMQQIYANYTVFVSLSGPQIFRSQAFEFMTVISSKSSARWYLQDEDVECQPQMEHLCSLLLNGSIPVNPEALVTFLDNDDMCHPARLYSMRSAYEGYPLKGYPVALPCKLLLDPSLTPAESQLTNFVNMKNPADFDHWRKHRSLARKVQLVSNSEAKESDAEEYFDYIVPSAILKKFFDLNPPAVRSHRFCDLRLWKILDHLTPIALGDNDPNSWFLAHYKVSMDEKMLTFDNHGQRINKTDQISFAPESIQSADQALSERYHPLSPPQVAMCRGHLESVIIQYVGWNDIELEDARGVKVAELNRSHGNGFGDELWEECISRILSLFDPATLHASKGTWVTPDISETLL